MSEILKCIFNLLKLLNIDSNANFFVVHIPVLLKQFHLLKTVLPAIISIIFFKEQSCHSAKWFFSTEGNFVLHGAAVISYSLD